MTKYCYAIPHINPLHLQYEGTDGQDERGWWYRVTCMSAQMPGVDHSLTKTWSDLELEPQLVGIYSEASDRVN